MTPYEVRLKFKMETGESPLYPMSYSEEYYKINPANMPNTFIYGKAKTVYSQWLESSLRRPGESENDARRRLQLLYYKEKGKSPTSYFLHSYSHKYPETYYSAYGEFLEEIYCNFRSN